MRQDRLDCERTPPDMLGDPLRCRACGTPLKSPRRGQRACSPQCRWRGLRRARAEHAALLTARLEHLEWLLGQARGREAEIRAGLDGVSRLAQILTARLDGAPGDRTTRRADEASP